MYEFNIKLNLPAEEVVGRVQEALQEEKFGIVSEIDVQGVMKKKLDRDIGFYRILGACNPNLASRVLDELPNAGALLPCNVVVRADGAGSVVSFMDPLAVLGLAGTEGTAAVAGEARAMLERVRDRLLV